MLCKVLMQNLKPAGRKDLQVLRSSPPGPVKLVPLPQIAWQAAEAFSDTGVHPTQPCSTLRPPLPVPPSLQLVSRAEEEPRSGAPEDNSRPFGLQPSSALRGRVE